MSYPHFVYGISYLTRFNSRQQLARASSTRAGGADKKEYRKWREEVAEAAR